jgi:high-affinity K+ transport system ATPase subunit B
VRFHTAYFTALSVFTEVVFFAVASLIFWHKSGERMALFVSMLLVTLMPSASGALDALVRAHPAWWLPATSV